MKAIVPLVYVDPLSQIERKIGVLIVDSGAKDIPISRDDFEYLKVIGDLIGAAVGKAKLVTELIE
jgi:GAF domain-containing protein